MKNQNKNRAAAQGPSDQWYAAVEIAGSTFMALMCGVGIVHVGIVQSRGESTWEGILTYQESPSVEQAARISMAGEAALMLFRLQDERTITVWDQHRGLAELVREWSDYWRGFGTEAMIAGMIDSENLDLRIEDTEIGALLTLFCCQAYRLLRQGTNQVAVEALAEQLREMKTLMGEAAKELFQKHSGHGIWSGHIAEAGSEEPQLFCPDLFGDWRQGTQRSIT